MNMVRQFKSGKIQLTMVSEAHPKGIKRTFNNVIADVEEEQITTLGHAIEALSGEQFSGANIINNDQVTFA
ncbi:hypothetical protein [Limosilactobacillus frumenti]|nr:hypothetical protein [Limosilactobacillus frumenti]MBA2914612.1 hypothetical protein [Limosilactobacillus frumenti]QFG72973.1 hypothetical protein LF145_06420 [Limosilactobacillus frumenti]